VTSHLPLIHHHDTSDKYYINQAGGGGGEVGPVYSVPPFIQRGHGIGDVLGTIFRSVRYVTPYLFSGFKNACKEAAKFLGREALRTGGKILSEIADNPQTRYQDIISKNVQETFQNLSSKMTGRGRKRKRRRSRISRNSKRPKRNISRVRKQRKPNLKNVILKAKRRNKIKRYIFS